MALIRRLLTQAPIGVKPLKAVAALPVIANIIPANTDASQTVSFSLSSGILRLYFDCIKRKSEDHPDCKELRDKLDNEVRCIVGSCP